MKVIIRSLWAIGVAAALSLALMACSSDREVLAGSYEQGPSPIIQLTLDEPAMPPYDRSALIEQDDGYYSSEEAQVIAEYILDSQNGDGGWSKHVSMKERDRWNGSTIDNDTMTTEITFLARMYGNTGDQRYASSAKKGIDLLLVSQYENGGWPQILSDGEMTREYFKYVTFNDDAMVNVLALMRDIATGDPLYSFLDDGYTEDCEHALERGIAVILETQIEVGGVRTAWAQQYDDSLEPAAARAFEPKAICSKESVSIIQLLQSIESDHPEVRTAVDDAIAWLEANRIDGMRLIDDDLGQRVVPDDSAKPVWSRFYDIDTGVPIFGDRDGNVYYDLSEVSEERRKGYDWYGYWPEELF